MLAVVTSWNTLQLTVNHIKTLLPKLLSS